MAESEYTHVGVKKPTQKKISILASVLGEKIYELVECWADDEWDSCKRQGLVTDAMLDAPKEKATA